MIALKKLKVALTGNESEVKADANKSDVKSNDKNYKEDKRRIKGNTPAAGELAATWEGKE